MNGRFEYRVFDNNLIRKKEYLNRYYKYIEEKTTEEQYLLSQDIHNYNIKIRDNKLDVKVLHKTINEIEQWDVFYKEEFPIPVSIVNKLFSSELVKNIQYIDKSSLIHFIQNADKITVVPLSKKRWLFKYKDLSAEFAEVFVYNKKFHTVAVESDNMQALKNAIKDLQFNNYKNINYYKFLQ